jgi:hypothetical protein
MARLTPSAFISYSWDNEDHKTWVRELSERLVINGVQVFLDQWHVKLGESLTEFMENKLSECDFALVICTPNYRSRSQARKGGVGYEQQIISGELASGIPRRKFIPLIRSGEFDAGNDCAIPSHFLGIRALDVRSVSNLDESFEELLRTIYDVPRYSPPALGSRPTFILEPSVPTHEKPFRLATAELDGWYLESGVAKSELYPKTFTIPTEQERRSVSKGYLVKLVFEIALLDEENDNQEIFFGERMWVEVSHSDGPYIIGALNNTPASFEGDHYLRPGAEIIFLPEHIIDIIDLNEKERMIGEQSREVGRKNGSKKGKVKLVRSERLR